MNNEQEKQTLVEEGTEFSGTLKAKCKVVVRGGVEGELEAPSVEIADTGSVTGTLRAKSVRSQGTLAGIVEVDDIAVAGTVRSDTVIRAKTLEVKLGASEGHLEVTFGDCVLEVGEMPGDQPADDDMAEASETTEAATETMQAGADGPDAADDGGGSKKSRKRRNRNRKNRGKHAPDDGGQTSLDAGAESDADAASDAQDSSDDQAPPEADADAAPPPA